MRRRRAETAGGCLTLAAPVRVRETRAHAALMAATLARSGRCRGGYAHPNLVLAGTGCISAGHSPARREARARRAPDRHDCAARCDDEHRNLCPRLPRVDPERLRPE
jgi:hypothetical protein